MCHMLILLTSKEFIRKLCKCNGSIYFCSIFVYVPINNFVLQLISRICACTWIPRGPGPRRIRRKKDSFFMILRKRGISTAGITVCVIIK